MRVYVAGSSSELERARGWMQALRSAGVEVTSDWPEVIATVGIANPRDASETERRRWSNHDLEGVEAAHVVWFLVSDRDPARGAYYELGYAQAANIECISSGDTVQSIFLAQTQEFAADLDAFDYILWLADHHDAPRGTE